LARMCGALLASPWASSAAFLIWKTSATKPSFIVPACAVNAPHRRDRVWIVAHAAQLQRDGGGEHTEQGERQVSKSGKRGGTDGEDGGPQQWLPESRMGGMADGFPRWLDEPDCGRVATGVKNRVPRLKALGNAVVPQVVEQIGRAILAAEEGE